MRVNWHLEARLSVGLSRENALDCSDFDVVLQNSENFYQNLSIILSFKIVKVKNILNKL